MKGGNVPILTYSHLKINSKVLNAQNNHFIAYTMLCDKFNFRPELPPKFSKILGFPRFMHSREDSRELCRIPEIPEIYAFLDSPSL